MTGQLGNIIAVRTALSKSKSSISKKGLASADGAQMEGLQDLLGQYDNEGLGKLGKEQVRKLLMDCNRNEPVSDDEVDYVIKIADTHGDFFVHASGMGALLSCWQNYQASREEIERHFAKHDPDGTGRLDKRQLKNLLVEQSRGLHVDQTDVEKVLKQSDVLKNGVVTKPELRRALAVWNCHVEAKKACCVIQ